MDRYEIASMQGAAAGQRLKETGIAILPLGAVEHHGPHLPLGTDTYIAAAVARRLAERVDAVILPPLSYGQVWSLYGWDGTFSVSNEALVAMICGIGRSLRDLGVPILALVNGHVGNVTAMKEASRILDAEGGPLTFTFTHPGMNEAAGVLESPRFHPTYYHADEIETSMMLYLAPEHVDMSKAIREIPVVPPDLDYRPTRWREITQSAVLGDATLATAAKGKALIDVTIERMASILIEARKNQRRGEGD